MPMFVKVSGTWKTIAGGWVKVSGTWKTITGGWVNVSGTWKKLFQLATLFLTDFNVEAVGFATQTIDGSFTLATNGQLSKYGTGGTTNFADMHLRPLTSGIGSAYEARLVKTSGTDPESGPALSSWVNLGTERTWNWQQAGGGLTAFEGTLEIGSAGANVAQVSCTVTVQVELLEF